MRAAHHECALGLALCDIGVSGALRKSPHVVLAVLRTAADNVFAFSFAAQHLLQQLHIAARGMQAGMGREWWAPAGS